MASSEHVKPSTGADRASLASRYTSLHPAARRALLLVLAALALLATDIVALRLGPQVYTIDAGTYRASYFLQDMSGIETGIDGATYRWTLGDSAFVLSPFGPSTPVRLTFELGGRPEPGQARLATSQGGPWTPFVASAAPQHVQLVVPGRAVGTELVQIQSETFSTPSDPRTLGLKVNRVTMEPLRGPLPLPPLVVYVAQLALAAMAWWVAGRLGGGRGLRAAATAVVGLAVAVALPVVLPQAEPYATRMLTAGLIMALVTWAALPKIEALPIFAGDTREPRLLWAIMIISCLIRVVGALFPTFAGQDLHYHQGWAREVLSGDLILAVHSSEFGNGVIVYPPGTYVTLMPGFLLSTSPQVVLQGALGLIDGSGALSVALLALYLGQGKQVARFAAVLYAGSLPMFTAIAYGFSAQVFAQWFIPLLALGLLYALHDRGPRSWALAMLLLLLPMLVHIGQTLLAAIWVCLLLLVLLLRPSYRQWWRYALAALVAVFSLLFLYTYGLNIMLDHAGDIVGNYGTPVSESAVAGIGIFKGATPLMLKGIRLAYSDLGLLLLPFGAALLLRSRLDERQRLLVLTWGGSCLLFFLIDLFLALQVRYFYFAVPIVLVSVATALGWLARRGRWWRLAAWAMALGIAAQGVALWFGASFGDVSLSLTPLTH